MDRLTFAEAQKIMQEMETVNKQIRVVDDLARKGNDLKVGTTGSEIRLTDPATKKIVLSSVLEELKSKKKQLESKFSSL